MRIFERNWDWREPPKKRESTEWLILHHSAARSYSVSQVHNLHRNINKWSGIGYHFYIEKDGNIYTGRPIGTIGAHCKGHNHYSIGICFEGDFENEHMNDLQIKAGQELIQMIKNLYPDINICTHGEAWGQNTSCAGKNFPKDRLLEPPKSDSKSDILNQIKELLGKLEKLI